MEEKELIKRRKSNMRIFPIYRAIGSDFLFFYSINFLFLTQIKGISVADIVLVDAFYSIFCIFWQIPAAIVTDWIGKKKAILLGNSLNILYMIIVMFSTNIWHLFLAEFICAFAFGLKDIAELSMLNNSIPPFKRSDDIFSKIQGKGTSKYYYINAIAVIIAGFLFEMNSYIPILLSLTTIVFATFISLGLREVEERRCKVENIKANAKKMIQNYGKELKHSFRFILKSKRLRALLLFSSISIGFVTIMESYEVSLIEEMQVSAQYIGIIFALLGVVQGIATSRQNQIHAKFKNKTLMVIGITFAISILMAGLGGMGYLPFGIAMTIVLLSYALRYIDSALLRSLPNRYMRNFTDAKIVSEIFASKGFFDAISRGILGIIASRILNYLSTASSIMFLGVIFLIIILAVLLYMKKRVGLKPEEYPKEEIDYKVLQ